MKEYTIEFENGSTSVIVTVKANSEREAINNAMSKLPPKTVFGTYDIKECKDDLRGANNRAT